MQIAYCPNCGKNTEHKRALGAGTILRTLLTGGLSLLAVPVYGKGCIICGLTIAEAVPQQSNRNVTARDQIQGFLVLLGDVLLLVLIWLHENNLGR
jgi:Na+/pantothenate symporter